MSGAIILNLSVKKAKLSLLFIRGIEFFIQMIRGHVVAENYNLYTEERFCVYALGDNRVVPFLVFLKRRRSVFDEDFKICIFIAGVA